jgi:hypothetical protein
MLDSNRSTSNDNDIVTPDEKDKTFRKWDDVRDDSSCYIDEKEWIRFVQDKGVEIEGSRCLKGYHCA